MVVFRMCTLISHPSLQLVITVPRMSQNCLHINSSVLQFLHRIYDVTLGIADPNVFIPPEECF